MSENVVNTNAGQIIKEYPDGAVRLFTLDDGYQFEVYVPNDYSADTPVMMYEHGDGGYYNDWRCYTNKFAEGDCNAIIIRADRYKSTALYNHVVEKCGVKGDGGITVSFSGGTTYAMQSTADIAKGYADGEPIVSVILDGYVPTNYLQAIGAVDTYIEKDAVILAFAQSGNQNSYFSQYKELAKTGTNIVLFRDKSSFGNSHVGVNNSFTQNGILEYVLGEGELPDNYEILVYNMETEEFETIDYSQISDISKVYQYFGVDTFTSNVYKLSSLEYYEIKSDSGAINSYLNNIIKGIKKSSFLNLSFSEGCSSTTSVPNEVPGCVQQYFNSVSRMLISLSDLVDATAQIDPAYKEVDARMQKYIDELNMNGVSSEDV